MRTYAKYPVDNNMIKLGKENEKLIDLIREIAFEHNLTDNGDIKYRQLYKTHIKPKVEKLTADQHLQISYRQFKCLFRVRNRLPLLSASFLDVYFSMLCELLKSGKRKQSAKMEIKNHKEGNESFSEYCIATRRYCNELIDMAREPDGSVPETLQPLSDLLDSLGELDRKCSNEWRSI